TGCTASNNTCQASGHNSCGPLASDNNNANQWGKDLQQEYNSWSVNLCTDDSDGDGEYNGLELGDPCCIWTVGTTPRRLSTSHPGDKASVSGLPSCLTNNPTMTTATTVQLAWNEPSRCGLIAHTYLNRISCVCGYTIQFTPVAYLDASNCSLGGNVPNCPNSTITNADNSTTVVQFIPGNYSIGLPTVESFTNDASLIQLIDGLAPLTTYNVSINANNFYADRQSPYSSSLLVTTGRPREPGPPRNLTVNVNVNSATFYWRPPINPGGSPITNYTIEINSQIAFGDNTLNASITLGYGKKLYIICQLTLIS
ncbi:temptin precursor, partial [Planoprotostelium fungivorum]